MTDEILKISKGRWEVKGDRNKIRSMTAVFQQLATETKIIIIITTSVKLENYPPPQMEDFKHG